MKMIIRNDDIGYSEVNDLGMFETLDRGVSTACDVMLESPGTELYADYAGTSRAHIRGCKVGRRKIYFMDPGVIKCKRLLNQNTYKSATA